LPTSSLTRVGRILTIANSDATKKAFAATIKAARASAVLGLNMRQAYRHWVVKGQSAANYEDYGQSCGQLQ
jgi:hypothetical protein